MRTLSVSLLSLFLLNANVVRAQQEVIFDPFLSLNVNTERRGITVYSGARVLLYSAFGARLLKEVIVGHQIADRDLGRVVGEGRYVSQTGDAGGTLFIGGILYHCYDTALGMHANDYNRHETLGIGPVCADTYDHEPPPPPDPPG